MNAAEAASEASVTGRPQVFLDGGAYKVVMPDGRLVEFAGAATEKPEATASVWRRRIAIDIGRPAGWVGAIGKALIVFGFGYVGLRIGEHFGRHFEGAIGGVAVGSIAGDGFERLMCGELHKKATAPSQSTQKPAQIAAPVARPSENGPVTTYQSTSTGPQEVTIMRGTQG